MLYLRRYREYERRLAIGLRRIAAAWLPPAESAAVATVFAALFPQARAGQDRQALAAALALQRALLLVTGGPGTGKTTTIARLLLLRVAQARQQGQASLRIALAAPTGRAAERMAESLRAAAGHVSAAGGCGVVCRVAVGSEYGASFAWGDPRYAALSSLWRTIRCLMT